MEREELKNSVNSLLSTLKCPVCLVLVEEDHKLCVNGHATCTKCLMNQTSCPTCRSAFSNIQRNTIFSQILSDIPHPCRFDKCSYLVKSGDDHEVYCRYRPMKCRYSGCGWLGSVDNLTFHLEDRHPNEKVYSGTKNLMKLPKTALDGGNSTILISAFGHFLWQDIYTTNDANVKKFIYSPLWVGKPSRDIYLRILFKSEEREFDTGAKLKVNSKNENNDTGIFPVLNSLLSNVCSGDELKFYLMIAEDRNELINMMQE